MPKYTLLGDYVEGTSQGVTGVYSLRNAPYERRALTKSKAQRDLAAGAIGQVAVSAINAYNTLAMDKIRTRMQQSSFDFSRRMQRIGRDQAMWRANVTRNRVKELRVKEMEALQIENMKSDARVENELTSVGATAARLLTMNRMAAASSEFAQKDAMIKEQADLQGRAIATSFLGPAAVAARGTTRTETVSNFVGEALTIGKEAFGEYKTAGE